MEVYRLCKHSNGKQKRLQQFEESVHALLEAPHEPHRHDHRKAELPEQLYSLIVAHGYQGNTLAYRSENRTEA